MSCGELPRTLTLLGLTDSHSSISPPLIEPLISGQSSCKACKSGQFSTTAAAICKPCPIGSFSNSPASPECEKCSPGRFQDKTGEHFLLALVFLFFSLLFFSFNLPYLILYFLIYVLLFLFLSFLFFSLPFLFFPFFLMGASQTVQHQLNVRNVLRVDSRIKQVIHAMQNQEGGPINLFKVPLMVKQRTFANFCYFYCYFL